MNRLIDINRQMDIDITRDLYRHRYRHMRRDSSGKSAFVINKSWSSMFKGQKKSVLALEWRKDSAFIRRSVLSRRLGSWQYPHTLGDSIFFILSPWIQMLIPFINIHNNQKWCLIVMSILNPVHLSLKINTILSLLRSCVGSHAVVVSWTQLPDIWKKHYLIADLVM